MADNSFSFSFSLIVWLCDFSPWGCFFFFEGWFAGSWQGRLPARVRQENWGVHAYLFPKENVYSFLPKTQSEAVKGWADEQPPGRQCTFQIAYYWKVTSVLPRGLGPLLHRLTSYSCPATQDDWNPPPQARGCEVELWEQTVHLEGT